MSSPFHSRLHLPPVRWLALNVLATALILLCLICCVCVPKTKVDLATLKDRVEVQNKTQIPIVATTPTTQSIVGDHSNIKNKVENNPDVDTTTKTTVGIPWYGLTAILGAHGLILAAVVWWFGYRPGNWKKKQATIK